MSRNSPDPRAARSQISAEIRRTCRLGRSSRRPDIVTKQVRRDAPGLWALCVPRGAESPDDLVDAESRQWSVVWCTEDRVIANQVALGQESPQMLHCLLPEWT